MQKTTLALLAAAAVFATAGLNGCYTMLVHPGVQTTDDITGAETTAEVTHAERCTDCHTGDVHGSGARMPENHSGAYDGWSDYDPFWGYGNYYSPFWSSPLSSPYFSDSYYSYRNLPWWVYPSAVEDDGGSNGERVSAPSAKEKPTRRGNLGTDDSGGYSPLPSASRGSGSRSTEKPAASSSTQSGSGSDSDSGKEKPARRGGIR